MAEEAARQITLRLPEPLYQQVRQLARKRRTSVNRLAQQGLEALTREAGRRAPCGIRCAGLGRARDGC
jgi:hypothetical protein